MVNCARFPESCFLILPHFTMCGEMNLPCLRPHLLLLRKSKKQSARAGFIRHGQEMLFNSQLSIVNRQLLLAAATSSQAHQREEAQRSCGRLGDAVNIVHQLIANHLAPVAFALFVDEHNLVEGIGNKLAT